jgi:RNA polymerase sporulation-specific sigma factor
MDVEVKNEKSKKGQPHLKDEELRNLIQRSQSGDQDARNLIVNSNLRLVWSVVQRFLNRGYEPDDLYQIGCIGLLKSVDKFDLSFEVKFSTYAVPMIIGEIQRFIRDEKWRIKFAGPKRNFQRRMAAFRLSMNWRNI